MRTLFRHQDSLFDSGESESEWLHHARSSTHSPPVMGRRYGAGTVRGRDSADFRVLRIIVHASLDIMSDLAINYRDYLPS